MATENCFYFTHLFIIITQEVITGLIAAYSATFVKQKVLILFTALLYDLIVS